MKARIPKSFDALPKAQKEAVAEFVRDTAKQIATTAFERGLRSTITMMVKMSCIILHEQYGFGKTRLMQFLTAWQKQFPRELDLLERGERTAYHEAMMCQLFGDPKLLDSYMDYIYQRMEELERKSEEANKT